jgi:hypothetical protein
MDEEKQKQITLNANQTRLLLQLVNFGQSRNVDYLMKFETGLFKKEELKDWYDDCKAEYNELKDIKKQLKEE